MEPSRTVNKYSLFVHGLFGRNRTAKREFFDLIEKHVGEPILTDSELTPLVDAKLTDIRLKHGEIRVSVNRVTYEQDGHMLVTKFAPLDAKTIQRLTKLP